MRLRHWIALALLLIGSPIKAAELITGRMTVVDGDTLRVGEDRIRLHGIDAPETDQQCAAPNGGKWDCGAQASKLLASLVKDQEVRCCGSIRDIGNRLIAVCRAGALDISAEMVRRGMAWAFIKYSRDYVDIEARAEAARIGVFQAPTQSPWDFRIMTWDEAVKASPNGCPIKGNAKRAGECIYHLPWTRLYKKLDMNKEGRRWFCDEREAVAAGCRAAYGYGPARKGKARQVVRPDCDLPR